MWKNVQKKSLDRIISADLFIAAWLAQFQVVVPETQIGSEEGDQPSFTNWAENEMAAILMMTFWN